VPVLCDLDGVVWLSHHAISGSADAIARLRAAGHRVLFVTNNSYLLVEQVEAALADIGIPAAGDVLTSAAAAAQLVEPGTRVMICGGPGIVQAVERRGATVVTGDEPCDAVMVGFDRAFDYDRLRQAATTVMAGATLIGTNDDATYPTPDGPIPGGGALLAAVAKASGASPVVAGKPYEPMAALVRLTVGDAAARRAVMVGDRPETDGDFARTLGCRFALVWSGVTAPGARVRPEPDFVAADLAAAADLILARG
jgi:4-nitrophenyl phosphatase